MKLSKRSCPLCRNQDAVPRMHFTPEGISALNATYDVKSFKSHLLGYEEYLAYHQCQRCRMIYCETNWPDEVLGKVYEQTIDHKKSYEKTFQLQKRLYVVRQWERILTMLAIQGRKSVEGLKVFDFGCGWGDALDAIKGSGVEVSGFEQDRLKIKEALKAGNSIIQDPAQLKEMPLVDVFILNAVVEHVQNVPEIMSLAHSKLKEGGILVFSTMDFRPAFVEKNIQAMKQGKPMLSQHFNPVEHVNIYDFFTVKKTLKAYRFRYFASENVMKWAALPLPYLRNSRRWIHLLNQIEHTAASICQQGERSITVYARKVSV